MRHIIAATDFSDLSDHAVRTAAQLAKTFGAKLSLAHAFDTAIMAPASAYPMAAFASYYPSPAALRAAAQKQLDKLKKDIEGDIDVTTEVLDHPSAWAALCDLAERRRADLIVVATHGRTAVSRLLLGSVAETTLRYAPCSVLAVREAPKEGSFSRILVGTDFSPASKPALVAAANLARKLGAAVTVMHVYMAGRPLWGEAQIELPQVDTQLRESMVEAHREFFDMPFEVALMQSDNAALGMSEYAEAHGMDLVVVATHGRTGIKRMLMGSVAEATVRHAPCAVWTART